MTGPLDDFRRAILALNIGGNAKALAKQANRAAAGLVAAGTGLSEALNGIAEVADYHAAETSSWLTPAELQDRMPGHFDACDLRHWLVIADAAGVASVPAIEILSLTEDEHSAMSGSIELPPAVSRRVSKAVSKHLDEHTSQLAADAPSSVAVDKALVLDKMMVALDDLPENTMVRHVRCGSSGLKALAGVGAAGGQAPEVRIDSNLEIGPGWVRIGNRRMIDVADKRFVMGYATGPVSPSVFVARPWEKAARWFTADDPHRHGSIFEGKGTWPAEWRAFIERGKVIGVSVYYPWCGEATPENAQVAIEVRNLAQKIADQAATMHVTPLYMDVEFLRWRGKRSDITDRFSRDDVSCTLDFIETEGGIKLLEGGPPFTPIGGGHPCGFAGRAILEGVAFNLLPGVNLMDGKVIDEAALQPDGKAHLNWEAVQELANLEMRPASEASVHDGGLKPI